MILYGPIAYPAGPMLIPVLMLDVRGPSPHPVPTTLPRTAYAADTPDPHANSPWYASATSLVIHVHSVLVSGPLIPLLSSIRSSHSQPKDPRVTDLRTPLMPLTPSSLVPACQAGRRSVSFARNCVDHSSTKRKKMRVSLFQALRVAASARSKPPTLVSARPSRTNRR